MKNLWLFIGGMLLLPFASAQPATPLSLRPATSFQDMQLQFTQWSQSRNLDSTKGWKWYQRWQAHWEARSQPDGNLPPLSVVQRGINDYQRLKAQSANTATRSANWMPAGPEVKPAIGYGSLLHGMGRINCIAFHPSDSNIFWVGVAQGGVWKTTNQGQSWLPLTDDLPILRISDIAVNPQNPDEIYLSVGDYAYLGVALDLDGRKRHTHYGMGVYKTTDGGQTWQPTGLTTQQIDRDASLTRRVLIHPSAPQELVAAGIYGIRKSFDGGATWTPILDSLMWDIEVSPHNPEVLYATSGYVSNLGAGEAAIFKSTDFGDTWTRLTTGIPPTNAAQRIEVAVSRADSNYIYAIACGLARGFYGCYRSTDGGQTWTTQSSRDAGDDNILHWYFGGTSPGGQGTYDLVLQPDPNDPDVVYAGGVNLWQSKDGGSNWELATMWYDIFGPSLHADQHQMRYSPLDNYFYICNDGGIMRTREIIGVSNDSMFATQDFAWPTQWEDLSSGMQITSFYRLGLSESTPGAIVAGSQDNSTFIKLGGEWVNSFGGDGMECLFHPNDPQLIYGSSQNGRLVFSPDGGANYSTISNGITDDGAWTTPFMLHPDDPNVLYAAYGDLWRSQNQGATWSKVSNFPPTPNYGGGSVPASDMAISPSDPQTIYLTKRIYHQYNEPSRMWRTTDGGSTWTDITLGLPDSLYISYVSVSPDDPQRVWVSVSGFGDGQKVYRSDNGGDTWQNISLNLPNLPANCVIPQDSSSVNRVYVAMDRGIYYLSDDVAEWQVFAEGMPNVIVTELEIHPTERMLYASTFGRGMWMSDLVPDDTMLVSVGDPLLADLDLQLFPNPNSGRFRIDLRNVAEAQLQVEIRDITGGIVWETTAESRRGAWTETVELPLAYGLYFLRVSNGQFSRVEKFWVE